jgi:O-antigen ligase
MDQRTEFAAYSGTIWLRPSSGVILGASLAAGIALFSLAESPGRLALLAMGVAATVVLLWYPELALAAYVVIGDVKGNEWVASLLPVDLTLALGVVLLAGMALNLLRRRRPLALPPVYFLFIALVTIMVASLAYTPAFDAGLDKLGRFLTVTGIVIVAPFFVLTTPRMMTRFLIGFGAAAFAICSWSLCHLGGNHRLVSPSDNTIGLGHIACALFVVVWIGLLPKYSWPRRALAYPLLVIPAVALAGSASRGSVIACLLVVLASVFWRRALLLDIVSLVAIGAAILPFIGLPGSSIAYLGTLVKSRSVGSLLNFRGDLLGYGWRLLERHPVFGAGLGGFRYLSPNPLLYKWPHNIFLEIACELGIPAALLAIAIFGSAIGEAFKQLKNRASPYFTLSQIAAALLLVGMVNSINAGDINSDRSTWLFVSIVFSIRGLRLSHFEQLKVASRAAVPARS